MFLDVIAAIELSIAAMIATCVLLSSVGKRMTLSEECLELRNWLFRTRRIPYAQVARIDFRIGQWLHIRLANGEVISWPARTESIESFISELSHRVTQLRTLEISGDLEIE